MDMLYVHDWHVHQTYRADRGQPPWIKIHRAILRHHKWAVLSDAERGQLVAMWILAADQEGFIPADARLIRKLCYLDEDPNLQRFVALGFLDDDANVTSPRRQDDANVAPTRRQRDAPEESREEEKRVEYTEAFEELWRVHRRGPKRKAFDAYRKAIGKTTHDVITQSLKAYTDTLRPPQFTGQHLHRWLDEERWEEQAGEPPIDIMAEYERQRRIIYG